GTEDDVARVREVVRSRPALRVVRRGIHDAPREMRLGVGEWSDSEDGIKYRLVLVDREIEGDTSPELARIEEENDRVALGFYANYVERLSDLLVKKGLLSREELDRVREDAGQAPGVSRRDVWRV